MTISNTQISSMSFLDIATFLLQNLSAKDTNRLALVHREIFCGPPTSYVSRKVYNCVKRSKSKFPSLTDFVEKLRIVKPNLHSIAFSLQCVDINSLTLEWRYPYVRATTAPPCLDLETLAPNLAVFRIVEDRAADHCLAVFHNLKLPLRLRKLDFSGVHSPPQLYHTTLISLAKSRKTEFCSCCDHFTRPVWEIKWSAQPCTLPRKQDNEDAEDA